MGWANAAVLASIGVFLLGVVAQVDAWIKRHQQNSSTDRGMALNELGFVITTLREEVKRAESTAADLRTKLDDCTRKREQLERRGTNRD